MPLRNVQAISGVSTGDENEVMTVYPSICSGGLGRLLGRLYNAIPLRIFGVKLSNLLFTLPTAPLATLLYAVGKIFGNRYVLSNRRVAIRSAIGERQFGDVALPAIDDIEIDQRDGQQFYRAADLVLLDSGGNVLVRLEAVPWPNIFRQTILEARDAVMQTEAAMATIAARQPA